MKRQNFIIYKTPDGVLYKKYYRTAETASIFHSHIYSYSKRLNLPERLLYKFTNFYDSPQKKTPNKNARTFLHIWAKLFASLQEKTKRSVQLPPQIFQSGAGSDPFSIISHLGRLCGFSHCHAPQLINNIFKFAGIAPPAFK